jgi:hypothetical protein
LVVKMMRSWAGITRALSLASLLLASLAPAVSAARGVPGSPEFGIGVRINAEAPNTEQALTLSAELHPDWVSIAVSWAALAPEPGTAPDWTRLDAAVLAAHAAGSSVMLSLSQPPAWAETPNGPENTAAVDIAAEIASRYASEVEAIELFPAPNTTSGWAAPPNPVDYLNLYQAVNDRLLNEQISLLLVAGGLETAPAADDPAAWDDLDFLAGMYQAGANTILPVIGLRLSAIEGLPSAHAGKGGASVLRHYENVRKLMTDNAHSSGVIWITYLGFTAGTSEVDQTEWLSEAYPQIRAQLYIGAAFLQGVNTCQENWPECHEVSLLSPSAQTHPFTPVLRGILSQAYHPPEVVRGREKSSALRKSR